MTGKTILFDKFEFPILKGLTYLYNEESTSRDYLFVNEKNDGFSVYFEKDFPKFTLPKDESDREYMLLECKKPNKKIKFFCPKKREGLDSVVWYFYIEFINGDEVHVLPGQVRVSENQPLSWKEKKSPRFVELLEKVKLKKGSA